MTAGCDRPEAAGSATRPMPGDLNVQKTRILLMLALTPTQDRAQLAKIFNEYNGAEP
jgi:L-asparaginase/Glu-tRNA(Gln) amidotransferase subunit D